MVSIWTRVIDMFADRSGRSEEEVNDHVHGLTINNPFYSATSRAYAKGVVGTGFNIIFDTGVDDTDRTLNSYLRKWSKKGNCEVTGRFHFAQAQRIMAREYAATSGGYIVAHHYNNNFKFGYKFELIPLSRIDTSINNDKTYNGIEIDKWGKIKAIHIYKKANSTKSDRVPYSRLTLNVNPWVKIDQYSGVSPATPVLEALEYIDSYKAAEMEGAKQRADNPIFIKTPKMKTILEAARKSKEQDGKKLSAKQFLNLVIEEFNVRRLDKGKRVKGFTYIADDEDIRETGKAVDTIYNDMYKNEMRSASSGIGLSAASTAGFMSNSYNEGLRASAGEEDEFKIVAQDIIEGSLRGIIEYHFINGLRNKGLIDVEWKDIQEYRNAKFIRAGKGHIDPVKNEKAVTEAVAINKTKSMQRALAEKGIDYEEHLKEVEQYELAMLETKKRVKAAYEKAGIRYEDDAESTITDSDLKDEE